MNRWPDCSLFLAPTMVKRLVEHAAVADLRPDALQVYRGVIQAGPLEPASPGAEVLAESKEQLVANLGRWAETFRAEKRRV